MDELQYLYKRPSNGVNLNRMRLNNKWCDVTIRVNGKEIRAHKIILAGNFKYFEAMLSNDSYEESKEGIITMQSLEAADLEALITFAYSGEILLTYSNALELFEVANFLGEDDVKEVCINFVEKYLKAEDAVRVYKFAIAFECTSLKNIAKSRILENFENCSQTIDYLDLEYENLLDILSDAKKSPIETQRKFFTGMFKWIMHDANNRKLYVNDLLIFTIMMKLTTTDVEDILNSNVKDEDDNYGIANDIMLYYNKSMIERQEPRQASLIILKYSRLELNFQFYNFTEKKWSSLQNILSDGQFQSNAAILNDKCYYIVVTSSIKEYLQVFDPTTKEITTLHSSDSILIRSALCACTKFIYLCGGQKKDKSASDQVLRYDPQTNSFETMPPMTTKRTAAAAIIYQGCLYVIGGRDGSTSLSSVEKYDPHSQIWTSLPSMCKGHYGHIANIVEEKLYVCDRFDDYSVEVYESEKNRWQPLARMNKARAGCLVVAYAGKIFAAGGGLIGTTEIYDPENDEWQIDKNISSNQGVLAFSVGGLIESSVC